MKTATIEEWNTLVDDHFGYEAEDDVDGVLGTMTDDAEHEIIGGPDGPLRGKPAIRGFYERLFADVQGEKVEPVMRLHGDDFLVDETIWSGRILDGRPFRLPGQSGQARFRLLHVFQLRGGLIAKENVWFDMNTLARQLG